MVLLGVAAVGNSVGPTVCMQTVTADRVSNSNEAGDCCGRRSRGPVVMCADLGHCGSGTLRRCAAVWRVSAVGNSVGSAVWMQLIPADRVSNSNEAGDCCGRRSRGPVVMCVDLGHCGSDTLRRCTAVWRVSAVGNSVGSAVWMQTVTADRVSNSNEAGDCCGRRSRGPVVMCADLGHCGSGTLRRCAAVWRVSAVGNSVGSAVWMQTVTADRRGWGLLRAP
eukprot:COSAG02_NODE_1311_length_13331_cov_1094.258035_13_plen_222_part_00